MQAYRSSSDSENEAEKIRDCEAYRASANPQFPSCPDADSENSSVFGGDMCMIQSGGGSSPGTPAESPEPYVLQPQPSAGQPLPMPMPGVQGEEAAPLPTDSHLRPLAAADLPFVGGYTEIWRRKQSNI